MGCSKGGIQTQKGKLGVATRRGGVICCCCKTNPLGLTTIMSDLLNYPIEALGLLVVLVYGLLSPRARQLERLPANTLVRQRG